jgi:predicted nucleotidyltransferase
MLSEGYCIGGACFEMDLIDAKSVYKNNKEQNPYSSSKMKEKIVVTLNERGLKFISLKNNLMDFVYGHSATEPEKIFSDDEKNFYLNEILPRFEFENNFVRGLIKGGTIESSKYLKTVFEEKYMEFLKIKFPDKTLPPHMQSSVTFRIRALVIMARLIEFGIFKKKPGTKSGPYILQQT